VEHRPRVPSDLCDTLHSSIPPIVCAPADGHQYGEGAVMMAELHGRLHSSTALGLALHPVHSYGLVLQLPASI
jgi:hypothetical protein